MKHQRLALLIFIAIVALLSVSIIASVVVKMTGLSRFYPTSGYSKETKALFDELSVGFKTDSEKVHAFYMWITENIEYDYEFDTEYQHSNADRTVKTKKGICYDYASLFADMCRNAGIPCFSVDGYKKDDPSIRHTWSRVFFDNTWWNLDLTYDAIRLKEGKRLYGFHDIGASHKALNEDYIITRFY